MTSDSEKTPLTVPPRKSRTHFSSTWTTVFACVGLAVGTGNLWRFPRIVAETAGENGALVFILVWFVFLFLWSIPMLFIEYGLGRYTQRGVMQSFHYTIGIKYMWAALFLASISFLIGCYYTVIMGWSLYYMFIIMIHPLPATYEASSRVFYDYTDVGWPVLTQFISLLLTALATIRGVRTIERVNTVITPTFLLIIIALWIWSLTKAHAWRGLCFLFSPDWGTLKNPMLWVEALSQNAFDTGAGSGMFITYSSYIAREESIGKYAVGIPIGNNIISLICGMTSFSTVFSSMITEHPNITNAEILDILQTSGPGGSGISFIWYPVLLASAGMGGRVIGVIFYGGLFFAGLSSNIPNIENATRNLTDVGAKRAIVLPVLTILIFLGGLGSSLNLNILVNQDFTWGFALLLTGFLLQMLVIKYGSKTFREVLLNSQSPNDWKVPVIWEWIVKYVAPVEAMFVICWWIVNNIMKGDGHGNPWYELHPETLMTVFMQWIILVFILLIFNLIVYRHQPNPIVEHLDDGKFDTLHEGDCSSAMDGQEMKDAASRRMKEAEGGPVETPTSDTPAVKDGEEEEEKTS